MPKNTGVGRQFTAADKKKKRNPLTTEEKEHLIQLIAERRTFAYIVKYFKDNFDRKLYTSRIAWFRGSKIWQTTIKEKREAFDLDLSREFLASKKNRMRSLERARKSAMRGGFTGTDKESKKKIYKNSPAAAVAAIKQAQEEIEGTKVKLEHGISKEMLQTLLAGLPETTAVALLAILKPGDK